MGPDIKPPPPIPPPEPEVTIDQASVVRQRAAANRQRVSRDTLIIGSPVNLPDQNGTGIRIQ